MANIARPPCDEAAILAGPCDRPPATGGHWILAATILGSSMVFIDGTVVNVALSALQSALGAPIAQVQGPNLPNAGHGVKLCLFTTDHKRIAIASVASCRPRPGQRDRCSHQTQEAAPGSMVYGSFW